MSEDKIKWPARKTDWFDKTPKPSVESEDKSFTLRMPPDGISALEQAISLGGDKVGHQIVHHGSQSKDSGLLQCLNCGGTVVTTRIGMDEARVSSDFFQRPCLGRGALKGATSEVMAIAKSNGHKIEILTSNPTRDVLSCEHCGGTTEVIEEYTRVKPITDSFLGVVNTNETSYRCSDQFFRDPCPNQPGLPNILNTRNPIEDVEHQIGRVGADHGHTITHMDFPARNASRLRCLRCDITVTITKTATQDYTISSNFFQEHCRG